MKIPVNIGISRPQGGGLDNTITIRVQDEDSRTHFLELSLTLENFALAITGLYGVDCTAEVKHLERVGKVQEMDTLEFEMPQSSRFADGIKKIAVELAKEHCPEGWIADEGFNSQNSFFRRDDKDYARTTIRRWVEKETEA